MELPENVQKTIKRWGKEYKKGFFSYLVLFLLKNKPMYGFEIISQFMQMTQKKIPFQESGIYHILKRLNKEEFVRAEWQKSTKGPNRKYYTITDSGEQLIGVFTEEYVLPIINTVQEMVYQHFPDSSDKKKDLNPEKRISGQETDRSGDNK